MTGKTTNPLWFDPDQARKAAEFYASIFPDSRVGKVAEAAGAFPGGQAGVELTVEVSGLGRSFMGLNGGPEFKPNESVSVMIETEDQAETDRYWNAIIGDGGVESDCGWCQDCWGFCWQITRRVLSEATTEPDPAVAKRVFDARMTMKKIDVAAVEAGRRGDD